MLQNSYLLQKSESIQPRTRTCHLRDDLLVVGASTWSRACNLCWWLRQSNNKRNTLARLILNTHTIENQSHHHWSSWPCSRNQTHCPSNGAFISFVQTIRLSAGLAGRSQPAHRRMLEGKRKNSTNSQSSLNCVDTNILTSYRRERVEARVSQFAVPSMFPINAGRQLSLSETLSSL